MTVGETVPLTIVAVDDAGRPVQAPMRVAAPRQALSFDGEGCPALDTATSNFLVGQLQSGIGGIAATNTFAGSNVLSLTIQIDKDVIDGGGPILGVWASTHIAN